MKEDNRVSVWVSVYALVNLDFVKAKFYRLDRNQPRKNTIPFRKTLCKKMNSVRGKQNVATWQNPHEFVDARPQKSQRRKGHSSDQRTSGWRMPCVDYPLMLVIALA